MEDDDADVLEALAAELSEEQLECLLAAIQEDSAEDDSLACHVDGWRHEAAEDGLPLGVFIDIYLRPPPPTQPPDISEDRLESLALNPPRHGWYHMQCWVQRLQRVRRMAVNQLQARSCGTTQVQHQLSSNASCWCTLNGSS